MKKYRYTNIRNLYMPLTLKIPTNNDETYPIDCLTPVRVENVYMKYWITKSGTFCKTPKDLGIRLADALMNEIKIIKYLKSKPVSPVINPPLNYYFLDGKIVVEQKAIDGIDFFDYVANNRHGVKSSVALLKCIKSAMIYFNDLKIVFNDFALENFMVTDSEQLKLVLVDFGCSQIFNENKDYEWKYKNVVTIRNHQISPDILLNYVDSVSMSRDNIFDLLQKKDLFSIGTILFAAFFGTELWSSVDYQTPFDKLSYITILNESINERLNNFKDSKVTKLILKLILKLLPCSISNMISLDEFVSCVDEIEIANEESNHLINPNKKRRII